MNIRINIVKKLSVSSVALVVGLSSNAMAQLDPNQTQALSRFENLKRVIFETPYTELPNYQVKLKTFGKSGKGEENKLLVAARRTLNDDRDLIDFPGGQKLLQANGICFAGQWHRQPSLE